MTYERLTIPFCRN